MTKFEENFRKTFEIIQTCFDLKAAYLRNIHPAASEKEIHQLVYQGILKRKMKA